MTERWDLLRGCASAAILTQLAGEHGVPAEVVLQGTGIPLAALVDPEAEITAGQELRLVQNLVEELGHIPALGLEAGSRYHASTHGLMGFAVLSSRTIREALQVGVRYFRLSFTFADMRLEPVGNDLRIVLDDSETPADVRAFMTERDIAAVGTMQTDLIGTGIPAREFRVPGHHRYVERFEQVTGNTPTFGAPQTSILVAAELLDLPLPQASPQTAAMCERQCAELLQRRMARRGTAGEVRELLVRRSTVADQDDVARELNTSVRTLRRQLADEGTSFRELSAEVACLLAEDLLAAGLQVEDVAHRLGYATASSFTHAYRRWRGATPGSYARAARRHRSA
ncbi:MAG TPA: AraC family transcriptional regulator [Nocardioidaceae bacterium]|nr:AraC family transcriptional regulator [Nocardioidaceae bacterium]